MDEVDALKTQSASVKFLCSLRELPDFSRHLGDDYDPRHLSMINLAPLNRLLRVELARRHQRAAARDADHPGADSDRLRPIGGARRASTCCPCGCSSCRAHLKEGTWSEKRQEFGEQLIDEFCRYAPNFRDAIIDWTLLTPEDIEDRIGLTDGNIRHVDMIPQQMMSGRPLPGWSDYRTPIKNLYLCGAGTHPGGGSHRRPRPQRGACGAAGTRAVDTGRRFAVICLAPASLDAETAKVCWARHRSELD